MKAASATKAPLFGLAGKIFLASTLLVVAVLGATFGLTSLQANRTADAAVDSALQNTRRAVANLLAARTRTFAGMSTVSAQVPQFRERLLTSGDRANVLDQAQEYRDLIGAALVLSESAVEKHVNAIFSKLGLSEEITNVSGSGCSLGHPVACTGARMIITTMYELRRRGGGIGLASMCAGGGMGSTTVFEVYPG